MSSHVKWQKEANDIVADLKYDFHKYQEYENLLEMSSKNDGPPSLGWYVANTYVGRFSDVHKQSLFEMKRKSPSKSPRKSPRKSPSTSPSGPTAEFHRQLQSSASSHIATRTYNLRDYETCLESQTPAYDGPPTPEWYVDREYCLRFSKHYQRDLEKKMKTLSAFVARASRK